MQAVVGDRLHVHGNAVGQADKTGEIVEVHGAAGAPPYLVRFDDGHTGLCLPGTGRRGRARPGPLRIDPEGRGPQEVGPAPGCPVPGG